MPKKQKNNSTPPAVLVAEDEPTVRALAESIIEELGYATFSAANAREAFAVLESGTAITVLFTDINMPDGPDSLDGLELARRAVEMRPGLRVIYTTGGGLTDGMSALFVEGGTFLPKPYNVQRLVDAVKGDGEITEKLSPWYTIAPKNWTDASRVKQYLSRGVSADPAATCRAEIVAAKTILEESNAPDLTVCL